MWNAITANPDAVLLIVTSLLGIFGADRWRKAVRASTAAEVDRWANVAAAGIVLAIKTGIFKSNQDALATALERFQVLARAAGVNVKPEHLATATATIHRAVVAAGQDALGHQLAQLHGVAEHAMESLAKLPWAKL